jgi:hypothetical protein
VSAAAETLRRHGWPVAVSLLLVAAALAPLPLTRAAIGHPYGDMADHYWGTWWFGRTLLAGSWPHVTDLSHFPEALELWYVDPLGAALALPLRPLGWPLAYNLMVYVQIGFAAVAAYAFGADASADRAGGVLAAVIVGASPYVLGLVHSGLTEYIGLGPVVLFAWSLVRAMDRDPRGRAPPRHAWAAAGALLALCATQAVYYGIFGALVAGCFVLGPGWRTRAPVLARIGAVAMIASLPLAVALLSTFVNEEAAVHTGNAPGWGGTLPATDVLTWVRGGEYYFPDTPANGNPGILHVNYLGWAALGLAAVGAIRSRPAQGLRAWGIGVGAYAVLALGPRLAFGKQLVAVGGVSVLLPLGLLYFPGSPLHLVHQPYRLVAFLLPFLAVGAAAGVASLPRWARALAPLVVWAETAWVSPAPWPLQTRDVAAPAVYAGLEPGPVLDWPPDASTWNRDYLVWQVTHEQPVPYGVNVFVGERLLENRGVRSMLKALEDPEERATNRDVSFTGVLFPREVSEASLADLGFRYVVVHKEALTEREWVRVSSLLGRSYGDATQEDSDGAVWDVGAKP